MTSRFRQLFTINNNNNNNKNNAIVANNDSNFLDINEINKFANSNSYVRDRLEHFCSLYPKLPFTATFAQKNKNKILKANNALKLIEEFENSALIILPFLNKHYFIYRSFKDRLIVSNLLLQWFFFLINFYLIYFYCIFFFFSFI